MIRMRTCLAALTCLTSVSSVGADVVYESEPEDSYWSIIGYYFPDNDYGSCDIYTKLDEGGKIKAVVTPINPKPYRQRVDLLIDADELKDNFRPESDVFVEVKFTSARYNTVSVTAKGYTVSGSQPIFIERIPDDLAEPLLSHDMMILFPGKDYQMNIDLGGSKMVTVDHLSRCMDAVMARKRSYP